MCGRKAANKLIFSVLFKLILDPADYGDAIRWGQDPSTTNKKCVGKGVNMKAVVMTVEPADREARFDHIWPHYLEALTLVERLHRRLLDVIKDEFDRRARADINSVQALLLYNIGDKELIPPP
jgi:hypothetical protein